MNKNDFIEWLESIGARFQDCSDERPVDTVFVFGKDEYDKVKKHPRKYKKLYVPYIRVTWEDDPRELYIRDNGYTSWSTESVIKDMILKEYV